MSNDHCESVNKHRAWLIPSRELDASDVIEALREAGFEVSEEDTTLGLFETSYEIRGYSNTDSDQ